MDADVPPKIRVRGVHIDEIVIGDVDISFSDSSIRFKGIDPKTAHASVLLASPVNNREILEWYSVDKSGTLLVRKNDGVHTLELHATTDDSPTGDWSKLNKEFLLRARRNEQDGSNTHTATSPTTKKPSIRPDMTSVRYDSHPPTKVNSSTSNPTTSRTLPATVAFTGSLSQRHFASQSKGPSSHTSRATVNFNDSAPKLASQFAVTAQKSTQRTQNQRENTTDATKTQKDTLESHRPRHGLSASTVSTSRHIPHSHPSSSSSKLSTEKHPTVPSSLYKVPTAANITSFQSRSPGHLMPSSLSTSKREYTGIRNIGNTCYINAVLQALMALGSFVADLGHDKLAELTAPIDLRSFYRAFLAMADQTLQTARKTALDPSRVKLAIARHSERFRNNLQQDAHEFLISCLSELESELVPYLGPARKVQQLAALEARHRNFQSKAKKNRKLIQREQELEELEYGSGVEDGIPYSERLTMLCPSKRNFAGVVRSTLKCEQCGDQSSKYESIRCLTLNVFETKEQMVEHVISNLRGPSNAPIEEEDVLRESLNEQYHAPPTIDMLMSLYFCDEKVERRCEKCQSTECMISRKLVQLPRVLVLHLKRFSYDFATQSFSKLAWPIELTLSLSVEKWCAKNATCAGPIPYNADGTSTLLRSKSRVEALPAEEQKLKQMLQKDRAERKRKRAIVADSPTYTTPNSNATQASSNNPNSSTFAYGIRDENSAAYQSLLGEALDSVTTADVDSMKKKASVLKKQSKEEEEEEEDLERQLQPKEKKFKYRELSDTEEETEDTEQDATYSIDVVPEAPLDYHILGSTAAEHPTFDYDGSLPDALDPSLDFTSHPFEDTTHSSSFSFRPKVATSNGTKSPSISPPQKNGYAEVKDRWNGMMSTPTKRRALDDVVPFTSPVSGIPQGGGLKGGSAPAPNTHRILNALNILEGGDDDLHDDRNEDPRELGHEQPSEDLDDEVLPITDLEFAQMLPLEREMWQSAQLALNSSTYTGDWPIRPQTPLPTLRLPSASSQPTQYLQKSNRSLGISSFAPSSAANVVKRTSPPEVTNVDDDEDEDELLKKVMETSKKEHQQLQEHQQALRSQEEEEVAKLLRETASPSNDFDVTDFFDSEDEHEKTEYVKDEYEGDEVAPLSDEVSRDPPRPPLGYDYQLQAIVHHLGATVNSGHYVADVCSDLTKKGPNSELTWKTFDDAVVTPTTLDYVTSKRCSPYLLFYVHTSLIPAAQ